MLVVEDVFTTGKSTRETMDVAREAGASVVGAAAIVDRSGGTIDFGVPSYALVRLVVPTYDPEACPLCAKGVPVVEAGIEANIGRRSRDRGSRGADPRTLDPHEPTVPRSLRSVMRTFKVTVSYDGTDFSGFQRQANARSVQAELEAALAAIEGKHVTVSGAGRTDAGVHALGQVASFKLSNAIAENDLFRALNAKLPEDVRVLSAEVAAPGFNARFSARSKVYRYRISNTRVMSPFQRRFAWHISRRLDLAAMDDAARELLGEHDFSCFQAKGAPSSQEPGQNEHSHHDDFPLDRGAASGRRAPPDIRDCRHRFPEVHGAHRRGHARRSRGRKAHAFVRSRFARLPKPRRGRPDRPPVRALSRSR